MASLERPGHRCGTASFDRYALGASWSRVTRSVDCNLWPRLPALDSNSVGSGDLKTTTYYASVCRSSPRSPRDIDISWTAPGACQERSWRNSVPAYPGCGFVALRHRIPDAGAVTGYNPESCSFVAQQTSSVFRRMIGSGFWERERKRRPYWDFILGR